MKAWVECGLEEMETEDVKAGDTANHRALLQWKAQ